MNPQTILYAITIIGGVALAVYTSYKEYQNSYSYDNGGRSQNRPPSETYNRRRKRSRSIISKMSDDCSICLSTMEVGQIHIMECKHMFHKKCLLGWLNEKKQCPICRATVISANI